MLFVVIPLGQEPQLVATVVEPLTRSWRLVHPGKFWIHEQVGMPREIHLH